MGKFPVFDVTGRPLPEITRCGPLVVMDTEPLCAFAPCTFTFAPGLHVVPLIHGWLVPPADPSPRRSWQTNTDPTAGPVVLTPVPIGYEPAVNRAFDGPGVQPLIATGAGAAAPALAVGFAEGRGRLTDGFFDAAGRFAPDVLATHVPFTQSKIGDGGWLAEHGPPSRGGGGGAAEADPTAARVIPALSTAAATTKVGLRIAPR